MRQLILIIAICTGVLWGSPVGADEAFDRAVAAYKRGDFTESLDGFSISAKQGNATPQFFLGFMYDNGKGVPQDYAEAMEWYRKAAIYG